MSKRFKQALHKRKNTTGQQASKKMLMFINNQGNANQDQNKILFYTHQIGKH